MDDRIVTYEDMTFDLDYFSPRADKISAYREIFAKYFILGLKIGLLPAIVFFVMAFPPYLINDVPMFVAKVLFWFTFVFAMYIMGLVATLPFAAIVTLYYTCIALGYSRKDALLTAFKYGPSEREMLFVDTILAEIDVDLAMNFRNILDDRPLQQGNTFTLVYYIIFLVILYYSTI